MKCRICGKEANVHLRAHNIALCNEDFIDFLERRVLSTIKRYGLFGQGEKLLVAVSGGKDSLSLWYMLNKLGISADGFHIHLGIDGYSDRSLLKTKGMADVLGRKVYVFQVKEIFMDGIGGLSKKMRRKPCSLCGTLKRYIMNRACLNLGYDMIVLGHNLDDEASALLGNLLYWKKEYLWKKHIVLEGIEGHLAKKIKPFFFCSEREIASYAIISHIDYIQEECPFSIDAKTLLYKDVLNRIELRSPGTKLRFIKGYIDLAKESIDEKNFCRTCGYPSYSERCTVCSIFDRLGIEKDIIFETYSF